jgi:general secretion pathway protein K
MRQPKHCPSTDQHGFALASVLWLMAGLSIVVALVADAALSSKQRVAQLRERTDFIQQSLNTRAAILYRLSASRPSNSGLTDGVVTINTDSTPYQGQGRTWFQLQDVGGLISLNLVSRPLLASYLVQCGVQQDQTPALLDSLEDYIDSDNLRRINGAERETYTQSGQKEPRNSLLLSVQELWSVWGWAAHRAAIEKNTCTDHFTNYAISSGLGGTRVNPATAPGPVLKAMGYSSSIVDEILNRRATKDEAAIDNAQNASAASNLFDGAIYSLKTLHVRHRHQSLAWEMRYTLSLDSANPDRPWVVNQLQTGSQTSGPTLTDKIKLKPWPQQPPAVTTSDAARLLNL